MEAKRHGTDEDAKAILQDMAWRAQTLFRALDRDGDGVLSPAEIANAPQVLRALDTDGDGCLRDADLGGPTLIPGRVRISNLVKVLDPDGDCVIGPDDIAAAPERLAQLDRDGDGRVTSADDLPPIDAGLEAQLPMGTPSQRLALQIASFSRTPEISGPLPPAGRPRVQPGYMLIQEMCDYTDVQVSKKMFLLDEHGREVHHWHTPYETPEATVAYLLPDGNLLRTTSKHHWMDIIGEFPVGAHGNVTIEDKHSNVLWQWEHYHPGKECLHHDVEMMPNGNILVIAWHRLTSDEAGALGWRRQGGRQRVYLDKVYEVRPDLRTGRTEIVWEWAVADHVVQDTDPRLPNFGKPSEHPQRIDINYAQLDKIPFNRDQMIHMNTVYYNAKEDLIVVSSAIFNEIWIIDHSATAAEAKGSTGGRYGRGGDLVWRWGNPRTHGAGGDAEQVLYWQHDSHFVRDDVPHTGDIIVFNNGMRRGADGKRNDGEICMGITSGAYSDVIELKLPRDAEGRIVMGAEPEITWRFNADGEHAIYSPYMSGAQRMPNGNTLMVQAYNKRIVEVTNDGEIVLDFQLGGPGRMFRIYKYPREHPGIRALGL